jgi:putative oxidoreductase
MFGTRYLPFFGRLMIGLLRCHYRDDQCRRIAFPPMGFAVAVAIELGGGLLLIAGYRARYVAAALALFSLATALSFHSNFADQNQMIHFLKNVMIAGGLLQIAAYGAGALSFDKRRQNAAPGATLAPAA